MAQVGGGGNGGSGERFVKCSYRRVTMLVCTVNLIAVLYVLHSLLGPRYLSSSLGGSSSVSSRGGIHDAASKYTEEELQRIKDSLEARKAVEPHELMRRVKEIQDEANSDAAKTKEVGAARQRAADVLAQRLKELKEVNNQINQQALDEWRKKRLESVKKRKEKVNTSQKTGVLGSVSAMEPIASKRRRRRGKRGGKRVRAVASTNFVSGKPANLARGNHAFVPQLESVQEVRVAESMPSSGIATGAAEGVEPYVPEFVVGVPQFGVTNAPNRYHVVNFQGNGIGNGTGLIPLQRQPFFSLDDLPEFVYPNPTYWASKVW